MIGMDCRDFERVTLDLRHLGRGSSIIAARAINRTLTGVRTDVVRELRQTITPTAKIIRSTIKLKKASKSQSQPMGWLESEGETLNLIHYRARQTKQGVSYQIKKSDGRKLLRSAFIAKLGKTPGVFRRKYKGPKKPVKSTLHYGALPLKYRIPVRGLKGPAIPQVLGDEEVIQPILKKAQERLGKNAQHELEFFLSKI